MYFNAPSIRDESHLFLLSSALYKIELLRLFTLLTPRIESYFVDKMTEREEEERKKCLYNENPEKPWQCKKPHSCFLAMILSGVVGMADNTCLPTMQLSRVSIT